MLAFLKIIALLMTYDYITGFFFSISILIWSAWIAFEINYSCIILILLSVRAPQPVTYDVRNIIPQIISDDAV